LRAESEPELKECADWWTNYQTANPENKLEMIQTLPKDVKKKRRKKRTNKAKLPENSEQAI
jgi:hypothetical protein